MSSLSLFILCSWISLYEFPLGTDVGGDRNGESEQAGDSPISSRHLLPFPFPAFRNIPGDCAGLGVPAIVGAGEQLRIPIL